MQIYVINLERSSDRRAFMRDQLEGLGLPYVFFKGVDASKGELAAVSRYDERRALRTTGETLSPAELGCFASHYQLWQHCVTLDVPIVIMEDDVRVEAAFPTALNIAEDLIAEHRFLRLAGLWSRKSTRLASLRQGHELVRFHKGPVGTQCYAISPAAARILVQHAKVWIDAVDRYIDRFWMHGLASLAIRPFHVQHADEQGAAPASLIETHRAGLRRPLLWTIRHRMMRLQQRCARVLFNLRQ